MPEFLDTVPYCYLYNPLLVSLILLASLLLTFGYCAIGALKLTRPFAKRIPYHYWVALTFILCGLSHGARIVAMYTQNYWWEAGVLIAAGIVSIPTLLGMAAVQRSWQRADDNEG